MYLQTEVDVFVMGDLAFQFQKIIYNGPARYLYSPLHFMIFMDQGHSGGNRNYPDFEYGTEKVHSGNNSRLQIWCVNHYGVTVRYKVEGKKAEVTLFGEDIPMPLVGRTLEDREKSPKDIVEGIINKRAKEKEKHFKGLEARASLSG